MIRVVVADDQAAVREGLTLLLGLLDGVEVVATAADGVEAVDRARETGADVVLMDLRMPRLGGVGATERVRALESPPQVLVLTTYADDESIFPALRAGARGYLTKDAGAEEIARALAAVHRGETWLAAPVQARLVAAVTETDRPSPRAAPDAGLTEREREVLAAMARGLTNRDIARSFVISEATVKTHVNNLFAKLEVTSRAAAVALAWEAGLVTRG